MAQNENISLSLANKIDVLNKSQSVDARYGVYDTEEDALDVMADYGLDGRQVAVYTDKANGKLKLYLYNQVKHQLEPIDDESLALTLEQARQNGNVLEGDVIFDSSDYRNIQNGVGAKIYFGDDGIIGLESFNNPYTSYLELGTKLAYSNPDPSSKGIVGG